MKLLAGTLYDPGTRVQKSTASLLAMTALDTTNLRLTFTAPSNGTVLVKMHGSLRGAVTTPQVMLGVMDGATVKGRQHAFQGRSNFPANANSLQGMETSFLVTGLTGGTSYTWDAAYAVQAVVASTNLEYGGPDDTTGNNNAAGFGFYIFDTPGLLAGKCYDPGTAASVNATGLLAMTAFDTTNLRHTFTCPSTGSVIVTIRTVAAGTAVPANSIILGVLDGATVRARMSSAPGVANISTLAATDRCPMAASMLVTGLSAGTSYTWDAAYGVETAAANNVIKWGGADNNSGDTGWGGFCYEIWRTDEVPRHMSTFG